MTEKAYLGDGVYVEFYQGEFRLWTDRGPTQGVHEIYLDKPTIESLLDFIIKTIKPLVEEEEANDKSQG